MTYMCGDWPYCAGETENLVFLQLVQETGRVIQRRLMTPSQFGTDGLKSPWSVADVLSEMPLEETDFPFPIRFQNMELFRNVQALLAQRPR